MTNPPACLLSRLCYNANHIAFFLTETGNEEIKEHDPSRIDRGAAAMLVGLGDLSARGLGRLGGLRCSAVLSFRNELKD